MVAHFFFVFCFFVFFVLFCDSAIVKTCELDSESVGPRVNKKTPQAVLVEPDLKCMYTAQIKDNYLYPRMTLKT